VNKSHQWIAGCAECGVHKCVLSPIAACAHSLSFPYLYHLAHWHELSLHISFLIGNDKSIARGHYPLENRETDIRNSRWRRYEAGIIPVTVELEPVREQWKDTEVAHWIGWQYCKVSRDLNPASSVSVSRHDAGLDQTSFSWISHIRREAVACESIFVPPVQANF
jgi:hypothetical protein